MAGHSKWAQIKRKKGANDTKRGQLFSRLSKEITVAAKMGGGDAGMNPRLRTAIATAKGESMPADNIDRAIKKGTGEIEGVSYEELIYEGYGPGGIAVLVETATDNKNRTAAEVRSLFSRNNGNLAGSGSVAWMFKKKAYFVVDGGDEDKILEVTLDAGVEDVKCIGDAVEVIGPFEGFDKIEKALKEAGIAPSSAKVTYIPDNTTAITDEDTSRQVLALIEKLEDSDDVQNVYANFDISDELMEKLHQSD